MNIVFNTWNDVPQRFHSLGFPVTDFEANICVKVVYFRSDPRKTHVGSGQVRQSRKETNKKCVSKKVTAFATGLLPLWSPW